MIKNIQQLPIELIWWIDICEFDLNFGANLIILKTVVHLYLPFHFIFKIFKICELVKNKEI